MDDVRIDKTCDLYLYGRWLKTGNDDVYDFSTFKTLYIQSLLMTDCFEKENRILYENDNN